MSETYAFLIREPDWDSDAILGGTADPDAHDGFAAHRRFQSAVAELGATIVSGVALQNSKHGGRCRPGEADRQTADAVYTDVAYPESSEVITGLYLVDVADDDMARAVAAIVPTGNVIEWRKVFPTGG